MSRKTPVLLRRAPLSGKVNALTRYTRKQHDGREMLQAGTDGKHDVTADFDAIVCVLLLDRAPNAMPILDRVSDGRGMVEQERSELRRFYEALKEIVDRHNAGPHVSREAA